jgi:hypothetical protein
MNSRTVATGWPNGLPYQLSTMIGLLAPRPAMTPAGSARGQGGEAHRGERRGPGVAPDDAAADADRAGPGGDHAEQAEHLGRGDLARQDRVVAGPFGQLGQLDVLGGRQPVLHR